MRSTLVVAVVAVVALGCGAPRARAREPAFPVLATYTSTMVDVRTTLGRALIGVETRGIEVERHTAACDGPAPQAHCMRCELAAADDAIDLAALAEVKAAFDRYPSDVLEVSKIRRVALCRTLVETGDVQGDVKISSAFDGQRRTSNVAGTVDLTEHRMFINLEPFDFGYDRSGTYTPADVVHHELFHLFEFEVMYAIAIDDVAWRAQNPAGFAYATPAVDAPRPFGFVNAYASTNDREDRASVFQFLMAHPDQLCELAKDDPIVRAKTALVWERIAVVVGDAFLRQRAPCVTWIAAAHPAAAPPPAPPPAPRPLFESSRLGGGAWLAPPAAPSSLRARPRAP